MNDADRRVGDRDRVLTLALVPGKPAHRRDLHDGPALEPERLVELGRHAAEIALRSRSDTPASLQEVLSGVYAEGTLASSQGILVKG